MTRLFSNLLASAILSAGILTSGLASVAAQAPNDAVLLVRGIRPQIKDRVSKLDAKAGATAKALDDLDKALRALLGIIESADMQPTGQSYEVFDMLSARLSMQLATLEKTVKTGLSKVNQLLQKQKLQPIKAEPLDPKGNQSASPPGKTPATATSTPNPQ